MTFDNDSFKKIFPDLAENAVLIRSEHNPPRLPGKNKEIDWSKGANYDLSLLLAPAGNCCLRRIQDTDGNCHSLQVCRIQLDRDYIVFYVEV